MPIPQSLNRSITVAACLGLSVLLAPLAYAAEPDERAERAVATRQGALKLMGFYMGPLAGMLRGQIPIAADVIARNSSHIGNVAAMLPDVFRYNTAASEVPTEALPVIWENADAFAAKIETLTEKAADLGRLARAGSDEGTLKKAMGAMGQACGSCHDDFRVDDD